MMKIPSIRILFKRTQSSTKLFVLLLIIFVGTSAFFALKLKRDLIPDETYHFLVSKLYSITWGIPANTPETYRFGNLGHGPFLYYWINGRALNALRLIFPNLSDWRELVFLRLISVMYSLFTIIFSYKLAEEIIGNKWGQVLAVFLLTNTLMFVFISSGVSYDNLSNLCSIAGIYFLTLTLKGNNFYRNSIGWLIWITFGTLVKSTLLPLALIMTISWSIYVVINRRKINFRIQPNRQIISMLLIFVLFFVGNIAIYGINIVKFRKIIPTCNQILTVEQCMDNRNFARHVELSLVNNNLTAEDILEGRGPDPFAYFSDYWVSAMLKMTLGVLGHSSFFLSDYLVTISRIVLLVTIFSVIKYWKKPPYFLGNLYAIFMFYTVVLFITNYRGDMWTGFLHIAVQGRYIFPVIGIIYILIVYFLSNIPNITLRRSTFLVIILLFWWSGPLTFPFKPYTRTIPKQKIPKDQPIGEIVDGVTITQEFVSECEGKIDQVELLFATYERTNTHPVIVRLIDSSNNRVIMENSIPGENFVDNSWRSFAVSGLSESLGKTFQLSISSPESIPGNAITIWSSTNGRSYPKGHVSENGRAINKDLDFQYQCTQSIFTGWFN